VYRFLVLRFENNGAPRFPPLSTRMLGNSLHGFICLVRHDHGSSILCLASVAPSWQPIAFPELHVRGHRICSKVGSANCKTLPRKFRSHIPPGLQTGMSVPEGHNLSSTGCCDRHALISIGGLMGVVQWTCVLYLHSPQYRKKDTNCVCALPQYSGHAENTASKKVKLVYSIYISFDVGT
jgi:hypothetical protein